MGSTGCTFTTRRRICKTYVNGPIFDDVDGVGGPVRSLGRSGLQPTDHSPDPGPQPIPAVGVFYLLIIILIKILTYRATLFCFNKVINRAIAVTCGC